ncbi:MAG: hypothetical protein ACKN9Q_07385, partial [Bacteroidota bacterium]
MSRFFPAFFLLFFTTAQGQSVNADSMDAVRLRQLINLSEVVLRSNLDVDRFIQQVRDDTTFYKAFRNLRVLEFTSSNDILLRDKKAAPLARMISKTKQVRE